MADMQPYCVLIHSNKEHPERNELELRPLIDNPHPEPCEGHHASISTETLTRYGVLDEGTIVKRWDNIVASNAAREMLYAKEYRDAHPKA